MAGAISKEGCAVGPGGQQVPVEDGVEEAEAGGLPPDADRGKALQAVPLEEHRPEGPREELALISGQPSTLLMSPSLSSKI